MKKIISIIRELMYQKFWGEISFRFENGKIVCIKKVETLKEDLDILNETCL
jgi:hypothetical protein